MKSRIALSGIILAIFVCGFPGRAVQRPQPLLIVLSKPEAKAQLIDPATKKVVAEIGTGTGPHEVTVSADGKLGFVANYGDQTPGESISVIDLAARKELRRLSLGALRRPHGILESKGKIYFTVENNKAVARYDPATDRVDWLMGTGQDTTHMLVMKKDQTQIFTANIRSDSVAVLEPVGNGVNWRVTVIPVGKGPEGIDLSPDEKEVWTAHSVDGGVSIIDAQAKKVIVTIPALTKHSNRLKFTPDGKLVLISDPEANEVLALDAKSHKLIQRISVPAGPVGIQITPDGKKAYVACSGAGKIAVLDVAKLAVAETIEVAPGPDGMAWVQ
jgi:YVTN family beta-propeller protein